MKNPALNTILKKLKDPSLIEKLVKQLSHSELNSLLLDVLQQKASHLTPSQVLSAYRINRFVRPANVDVLALMALELELLQVANDEGFEVLELSPLAPFGNCSALAPVNQNKIVSALRGTEVVADATNLLALESVNRRQKNEVHSPVLLSTVHRHVRAQPIPEGKGYSPHFKIFCASTAGRDIGAFEFEWNVLEHHLKLYSSIFSKLNIGGVTSQLLVLNTPGHEKIIAALEKKLATSSFEIPVIIQPVPYSEHRYYQLVRLSLYVSHGGMQINVGDGGFLDWTQKLSGNKKERFFASGVGLDLILKLKSGAIG